MKGIMVNKHRIVHARFMIEISWKESSVFWKWFRYYIFPLWREEISSFLVISSWPWHRKPMSTPCSQGSLFLMERTAKYFWPIKLILNNQSSFKNISEITYLKTHFEIYEYDLLKIFSEFPRIFFMAWNLLRQPSHRWCAGLLLPSCWWTPWPQWKRGSGACYQ